MSLSLRFNSTSFCLRWNASCSYTAFLLLSTVSTSFWSFFYCYKNTCSCRSTAVLLFSDSSFFKFTMSWLRLLRTNLYSFLSLTVFASYSLSCRLSDSICSIRRVKSVNAGCAALCCTSVESSDLIL
jgi:hypothetical protein